MLKYFFKYLVLCLIILLSVGVVFVYTGANYKNSRPLTEEEVIIATSIYRNQIDLEKVRLAFDTIYSKDSSKTLGNTIHINTKELNLGAVDSVYIDSFNYKYTFIHELGHVWQYQTGGWGYIPKSLLAQGTAWIKTGSRDNAYRWQDRLSEGAKWETLNPEEQAQSISDYFYYRELGSQVSLEQLNLKKRLECFIPLLIDSLCESQR